MFILLHYLVEQYSNMPMDEYLQKEFYGPMGLERMGYNPTNRFDKEEIVPSTQDYFTSDAHTSAPQSPLRTSYPPLPSHKPPPPPPPPNLCSHTSASYPKLKPHPSPQKSTTKYASTSSSNIKNSRKTKNSNLSKSLTLYHNFFSILTCILLNLFYS